MIHRGVLTLIAVVLVGVLLHAPSLGFGFFADDYSQQLVLDGTIQHETFRPASLYDFGGFADHGANYDSGAFPWWTSSDWKVRFFRPLTSWTLMLDHALYGRNALGYHATNLALYALLLVLAHRLYLALGMSRAVALLALLLFAVEDGSLTPVGWLANRNSLLEVLFTVSAVLSIARNGSGAAGLFPALLFSLAACLSKESGVAAPVLVAFAITWREMRLGRRGSSRDAARAALVVLLSAPAYIAGLLIAGYGSRSVFYPAPWTEPLEYARHLGVMLTSGSLALVGPFATDLLVFLPELLLPGIIVATAIVVPLAIFVWKRGSSSLAGEFFVLWMLVTLLPQAGAPPSDRLLFGPSVGSSAILALFLSSTLSRAARAGAPRWPTIVAALVALCALPLSALALFFGQAQFAGNISVVRSAIVDADVGDPSLGKREVFLLQSPSALISLSPLATWGFLTGDRDVRFWTMQMGRRALSWTRVDDTSFDLESLDEPFLTDLFEGVFLSSAEPPPLGTTWRTALFRVEARRVDEQGLRTIRVRLDRPLDDARLRFLIWRDGKMRAVTPPRIGETVRLASVPRLSPFMP